MNKFDQLLNEYTRQAHQELLMLSERQVHVETALRWAGRALAARKMGIEADYASEAIEHASLSADDLLLNQIRQTFSSNGVKF